MSTRTIATIAHSWRRDGLGVFHPDAASLSRWRLSSGRKSWISFTSPSGAKAHAREWLAMHPQGMLQDTAAQPQTGRQSGEDRGGVPLSWNHAAVSPAQNCYLSIDHSWPSEHARYGQLTFSKFLKTKGELVYWACFSSLFAIFFAFDPMWILQTLDFKKKRVFGHLDTFPECHHVLILRHQMTQTRPCLQPFRFFVLVFFFKFRSFWGDDSRWHIYSYVYGHRCISVCTYV